MRNLTQVFLNSAPSRFKLAFGVNENIILKSMSNEVRRDKNGVKIKKNCYMTFTQVDPDEDNKVLAESTFSYFNIDRPDFAVMNFIHQVTQLNEILQCVVPKAEQMKVLAPVNGLYAEYGDTFKAVQSSTKATEAETKNIEKLQEAYVNAFIKAITPYLGEESPLLKLVVVTDKTGRFYDLPREDKGFIARQDSKRKISVDSKYANWYADRNKPESAESDDLGDEEVLDEEDLIIADDDQDIEGI